jgi:hypothetical protein
MTVASNINKTRFLGSNSAGPFLFGFKFFQNEEILVVKMDADGTETALIEGADYTLSGAGLETGGNINLSEILPTGEELIIYRVLDILQETSFINQGAFYPNLHEAAFDKLVMMIQQISEETGRAIKMPVSHFGPFTVPGVDRADTLIGFDADGNPVLRAVNYLTISSAPAGDLLEMDIDASAGPVSVDLPTSGEVRVTIISDTGDEVTLATTDGSTILRGAGYVMSGYDEFVRLKKVGTNWRKC